ncbi:MAG TPA: transglutaminase-like domain-containing protein [Mycobacteriales bacterium]|nr:transglutaminase-like domain-containing protein [Mycobacteriales bacterium]
MTARSRAQFAEVVRAAEVDLGLACLLVGAEVQPDLDVPAGLGQLDALASAAAARIGAAAAQYDVAVALGEALGRAAGFHGTAEDYGHLRSSLLHEVLTRRRGLPILLSVVYTEVGRRLGRPVHGLGLPGHFVVGVFGTASPVLLDPFDHGRVTAADELAARIEALTGPGTDVSADLLRPWDAVAILGRVLANIRAHSANADALRTRLWATELSLLLPRHPVSLRRERGEMLAQLGDYVGAAAQLEDYAEVVADADPDASELSLRQAQLVRSRLS